ncbi:MAG: hypothetical protein WBG01_10560 [Bacteroidota bacterium]|jgi:hypothetical protein
MKHEDIIQELHLVAEQLGVTVRYEKGDFEGGYCILRDQKMLLVNKRLMPGRKASILAVALQEIGMDTIYLKPVLRAFVEDEAAKKKRVPS